MALRVHARQGISFKNSKSRTLQSFRKDADINNIMAKYAKTGFMIDPSVMPTRKPFYGDFSTGTDFLSVQNRLVAVQAQFNALNADIRDRFKNNPALLLDFLADPKNNVEAVKLGLKDKSVLPADPAPQVRTAPVSGAGAPSGAANTGVPPVVGGQS